ncbi:MAG TPA: hypothetical protein VK615_03690 [Candidatus Binatia bacterium]|nr:hypothetical protein [Candidatus Binatia bacterium]
MHVGDSIDEDLRGAEVAGFQSMLLDRNGRDSSAIKSLAELLPN